MEVKKDYKNAIIHQVRVVLCIVPLYVLFIEIYNITIASMLSWNISRPKFYIHLIHMVGAFKYLSMCLAVVCRL